jgi:hypothetical protein
MCAEAVVIYIVCKSLRLLKLLVVMSYKSSVYPIMNLTRENNNNCQYVIYDVCDILISASIDYNNVKILR